MRCASQRTRRAPRGEVDLDAGHARQLRHMALVQPDARRAGNAFDDQRSFTLVLAEHAHETLLEIRVIVEFQPVEDRRHRFTRRLGQGITVTVVVGQPVVDDRLCNSLTADAAHGSRRASMATVRSTVRRNDLPTVIATLLTHPLARIFLQFFCSYWHSPERRSSDAEEYMSVP